MENKEITQIEKNESKIQTFTKKVIVKSDEFYNSNWSIVVLLSAAVIFAIIQALLFNYGVIDVNGINHQNNNAWEAWLSLALTSAGSSFQFVGIVYALRYNAKMSVSFTLVGSILMMSNAFLSKVWFSAITFLLVTLLAVARYFLWSKHDDNTDKMQKKNWIWMIVFNVVFITAGSLVYGFDVIEFGTNDPATDWTKYMDVLNSSMIITGSMLMLFKSRWANVLWFLSGIPMGIVYGTLNQVVFLASLFIFKINDVFSFMAMSAERK